MIHKVLLVLMLLVMYGIGAIVIKSFGAEYHSPKQQLHSLILSTLKKVFIGLAILLYLSMWKW
jgi:Na+-transporting methylmalonyl-CoA/oxaloacetate decarboxylase gamma subunit